jgi:hypothetical protein
MLLSLINKRLVLVFGVLVFAASATRANVCDRHLLRIKQIPFEGNSGIDAHYDALIAAGHSAVPCLIANVTNTQRERNPRPIPSWGGDTRVFDTAVYLLSEIARFDVIKLLPRKYQDLYPQMGVLVMDKYLHDGRVNRRNLQRKLWRWYRTTYLPSLRRGAT